MGRLHGLLRTPDSAHAALVVGGIAIALGGAALFAIVAHTITPLSTQRVMGLVPRDSLARVELVIPAKAGDSRTKGLMPIRIEAPAPALQSPPTPPDATPDSLAKVEWEGPPPKPVVLTHASDENLAPAGPVEPVQAKAEEPVRAEAVPAPVEIRPVERTRIAELAILEAKWTRPALLPAVHIETRTEEPALPVSRPVEARHAAASSAPKKMAEPKRAEPKPALKLAEARHVEPKPAARPIEHKVAPKVFEAKRADAKAVAAKALDARRAEAKPVKTKVADARRYEPKAIPTKAAVPKRIKTRSASLKVSEAKPAAPHAAPARLAEARHADIKRAAELKAAEARLAEVRREAEAKATEAKLADARRAAEMQAAEARLADARHAAEMQAAEAKLAEAQRAAEMQAAEAKLAETKREVETTLAEARRAKAKLQETKQALESAANPLRPASATSTSTPCETCGTVTSVTTRMLDRGSHDIEVRVHFSSGNNIVFVYPNDPGLWSGDRVRLQGGRLMRM